MWSLKYIFGVIVLLEFINNFLQTFVFINVNAFYTIVYFFKHNFFFIIVLLAIVYMIYEELKMESFNYVDDERKIV